MAAETVVMSGEGDARDDQGKTGHSSLAERTGEMRQHVPVKNPFVSCLEPNQREEGKRTWGSGVRGWKEGDQEALIVLVIRESRGASQEAGAWMEAEESTERRPTKEELLGVGGTSEMELA